MGAMLWSELRPRILSLVRMQRQWGNLNNIYDSTSSSRYDFNPLPVSWTSFCNRSAAAVQHQLSFSHFTVFMTSDSSRIVAL